MRRASPSAPECPSGLGEVAIFVVPLFAVRRWCIFLLWLHLAILGLRLVFLSGLQVPGYAREYIEADATQVLFPWGGAKATKW